MENNISVAIIDIDVCYKNSRADPAVSYPVIESREEDIVVEGYWPNSFMPGKYSFAFMEEDAGLTSVSLNNGHAFFAAILSTRNFLRSYMGWMASEVYLDYGFAQTAFMKLLNQTSLRLHAISAHELVGEDSTRLSLRTFKLHSTGNHSTGPDWTSKQQSLERGGCWSLCEDWKAIWGAATTVQELFASCPGLSAPSTS